MSLLALATFTLAACRAEEAPEPPEAEEVTEVPDFAPAPTPPVEPPPADADVAAREIEVRNPMPHPMIVTATVDGEAVELGTIPANATAEFTVQARRGASVELEARDEADTHRVQGSVTVGDLVARWTIQ